MQLRLVDKKAFYQVAEILFIAFFVLFMHIVHPDFEDLFIQPRDLPALPPAIGVAGGVEQHRFAGHFIDSYQHAVLITRIGKTAVFIGLHWFNNTGSILPQTLQQISLINIRKLSGNDSAAAAGYVKLPHFGVIFYGVTASRAAWPAQIIVDPHFHIALLRFFKRESYVFKPFFGKKNRLGKTAGGKNKKFLYSLLLHKIQLTEHFRKLHFIFPRPPRNRIKICRRIDKIILPTVHYILCNQKSRLTNCRRRIVNYLNSTILTSPIIP